MVKSDVNLIAGIVEKLDQRVEWIKDNMKEMKERARKPVPDDGEDHPEEYAVNNYNDNPGFYSCDYVTLDNPCLEQHMCDIEPRCPQVDGEMMNYDYEEMMENPPYSFWQGGLEAQSHAAEEAHKFSEVNADILKKVRASEQESKAKQVEAEQKAQVDQAKRDRKDLQAQITVLKEEVAKAD
jgi:hypothetical protein